MKICTKCNIEKSFSAFYEGRGQCRECRKAFKNNWQAKNRGKVAGYRIKHLKNLGIWEIRQKRKIERNKNARINKRKAFERKTKKSLLSLLKQRAHDMAAAKIYMRGENYARYFMNRARDVAVNSKRYRKIVHVAETFTKWDMIAVHERFNWQCFICQSNKRMAIDHHMPRHMGSPLSHTNAVLLCQACNGKKGRKHPENFYNIEQIRILLCEHGIITPLNNNCQTK